MLTSFNFWLIASCIFILAELIIPGGIIVFLGLAGLIVAFAIKFSWISSWVHVLTLWFFASLVLIVTLRTLAMKLMGGDFRVEETDDDASFVNEVTVLTEEINDTPGKIFLGGTTWGVISDGPIAKGEKVKIIRRDNIYWFVTKESL